MKFKLMEKTELPNKTIKAHLVLSSGGVKCISYAGAIDELVRRGVSFASVSACSAGSIIGALFCAGLTAEELVNQILNLNFNELFGSKNYLSRLFYPYAKYEQSLVPEVFCRIVGGDPTFAEMKIPFATVGVNLVSRKFLVYSKKTTPQMRVSEAVKIATTVPFYTPPHQPPGKIVLDAAIATESPVWIATDYEENLPIIVLQPDKKLGDIPKGFSDYINQIISAGVESRDRQLIEQIPGVSLIEIECGDVEALKFDLSGRQKEFLIESGKDAVSEAIRRYGINFSYNTALAPETAKFETGGDDAAAERGAAAMIHKFNEKLPVLMRDQVFISYSRDDGDWLKKFQIALVPYVRNQTFKVWDDTQIEAGSRWQEKIDRALDSTRAAVLLVTQNFLASEYISKVELPYFLKASEKRNVAIFWVAASYSPYEETPLKEIQCANDPENPLDCLSAAEQNKVIVKICKKIKTAFNQEKNQEA